MKKMFKYMIFGVSNVIPGVCSATIAMILKIYDDVLSLFSNFFKIRCLKKNFIAYLMIIIGIVIGIFGISYLYEVIPFILNMCFLGFVLREFPMKIENNTLYNIRKGQSIILFIIGLVIVLFLSLLNQQIFKVDYTVVSLKTFIIILVNAYLVSMGMILPGISGSLMLVVFGLYFPLIDAFKNTLFCVFHLMMPNINALFLVLSFGGCFIIGLVISSKIIKKVINKKPQEFMALVNGMILGTIINLVLMVPCFEHNIFEIIIGIVVFCGIMLYKGPKMEDICHK